MSTTHFIPRWASPPGDTIREALAERGLSPSALASALGLSDEQFETLLAGDVPLTIRLAERLTKTIGGSVEFWMTRDGQYRADQSLVVADEWAQRMPISDMRKLGWIASPPDDWVEQIKTCFDFFGVANLDAWKAEQAAMEEQTLFRSSPAFPTDAIAVAAWLRRSEVELSQIECRDWDRDAFGAMLPQLLPLTRERDPKRFIPELQARCADVGVATGIVRTPQGCPVSGAARQLPNGQPSIALSARYLADDHLWFTFFHEAAHLLIHGTDTLYVDEIEPDSGAQLPAYEQEADEFAGTLLVPRAYEQRLARASPHPFKLREIADEIGVSIGIVIGHLQHRGVLDYRTKLNKLKRHYKWDGPSLEMA